MSPAKKQTQTTEPKESAVTEETQTPETVEQPTTDQADKTESADETTEDGSLEQFDAIIKDSGIDEETITGESTEVAAFRAAAEFFKTLGFEYETTFDVHIDKSGIRAFVRHPQNGMRKAEFIPFNEIPLVQRQGIVDQVNGVPEDEAE